MSFDAPADPSSFEEAEQYFQQLVPVTASDYETLAGEELSRAFVVSTVEQLTIVQAIHDEIASSMADGEGFEAFARRTKKRLENEWVVPDSYRLETVFRTNVQAAYGRGRWYQQQDPEVTRVRKWMMFDNVADDRTSEICRDIGTPPTVKRHDDPYVAAHWPPLHHRCRSQWQSISNRRARKLGGETPLVDESQEHPAEGFGVAPPYASDWRPDGSKYTPSLMAIHDAKLGELQGHR